MSRSIRNHDLLLTCIRFPKSPVGAGQKSASLGLLALATLAFPLFAGIDMQTVGASIVKDGTCQQTGFIRLVIDGDEFPHAQPGKPVYVRIRLDGGAALCESLVPPIRRVSTEGMVGGAHSPIYLAMSLGTTGSGTTIAAPSNTFSILRWQAGEPEIWLVVRHTSRQWIREADGFLRPPDRHTPVLVTLGIDAASSQAQNSNRFSSGCSNLTSNTDDLVSLVPVSTEVLVDVSQMTTEMDGGERATPLFATLTAYTGSTGVDDTGYYGNIHVGTRLDLFSEAREIATVTPLYVAVDPPVAIQGIDPVELHSVVANTVEVVQYEWVDLSNEVVIGHTQTLVFDPIPTETTEVKVTVTDVDGNTGAALSTILVDIGALDPNGDGENNILDLYIKLPGWFLGGDSIIDLLHINIGN
jgi:hypothetical protein